MDGPQAQQTGLQALAIVAGLLQRPADASQIARSLGIEGRSAGTADILGAARLLGLGAVSRKVEAARIRQLSGPFIAELKGGRYAVVLKTKGEQITAVLVPGPQNKRLSIGEGGRGLGGGGGV